MRRGRPRITQPTRPAKSPKAAHNPYVDRCLILRGRNAGFFSNFMSILGGLDFYERKSCKGIVADMSDMALYVDRARGPSPWQYYFDPIAVGSTDTPRVYAGTQFEDGLGWWATLECPRARAHELITKYIKVMPHVRQLVDDTAKTLFKSQMVGVHYRGTDKSAEAAPVRYEMVWRAIDQQALGGGGLFIATDDEGFLTAAKNRYPSSVSSQVKRPAGGAPIHLSSQSGYDKGLGAVLDCLLLSRCNTLIRTSSSLGAVASYINPTAKVLLLNHLHFDTRA